MCECLGASGGTSAGCDGTRCSVTVVGVVDFHTCRYGETAGDDFVDGVTVSLKQVHVGGEYLQLHVIALLQPLGQWNHYAPVGPCAGDYAYSVFHAGSVYITLSTCSLICSRISFIFTTMRCMSA